MKNLVTVIFILILAVLFFEIGFYLGLKNQLASPLTSTSSDRSIVIEAPQIIISPVPKLPEFRTKTGISIIVTPAFKTDMLRKYAGPLFLSDKGLVKEATISVTYQGRIADLKRNAPVTPYGGGKEYGNFFLILTLENPITGVLIDDLILNTDVDTFYTWAKSDLDDKLKTNNIENFTIGDFVEMEEVIDLINNKAIKRNLILVKKGS